jgi:hypothetical protein
MELNFYINGGLIHLDSLTLSDFWRAWDILGCPFFPCRTSTVSTGWASGYDPLRGLGQRPMACRVLWHHITGLATTKLGMMTYHPSFVISYPIVIWHMMTYDDIWMWHIDAAKGMRAKTCKNRKRLQLRVSPLIRFVLVKSTVEQQTSLKPCFLQLDIDLHDLRCCIKPIQQLWAKLPSVPLCTQR